MPTIYQRLIEGVKLSDERAQLHLRSGFVRVDGKVVKDPDTEIREGARITLQPEAVTEHA